MKMRSSIFKFLKKPKKKNFIPIFIKEIQRFQVFHFTLSKPYRKDKTASVYNLNCTYIYIS